MLSKRLLRLFGFFALSLSMFIVFTFVSSPSAQAAPDFTCKKSDASYWNGAISMPSSVPTWIKGCFQRITINQGWTGTVSFMYLSPETNDLSSGDKTATLNAVYYYRGTAGVNYAGMCLAVTSTSNSDGRTNVMSIPDVGFGFSVPCSGWLGHNQSNLTSSTVTLYASKFNAGSNKTATFNYRAAADFSNNSDGTDKGGLWCYDFANVVPAPTVGPPNPPWKTPPCVADGSNYTFVNIIKTPPTYDGTISVAKYKNGDSLGAFPVTPGNINSATVGLDHSTPDSWSPTKTSNPGNFNNIWVNPSNHESNAQGNYRAYVNVPSGWKVVRATNRGSNATLHGSCGSGGKCSVYNVTVDNNGTTYVDFFFEPDINGNLDGVCPRNNPTGGTYAQNGKLWGWVRDTYNNGGASKVDVYIDGGPGNAAWGARLDANKPREAAVGGNYGFESDVPSQFFDGKNHTLVVYVLRNNGGFDGGNGNNPYQLAGSPRSFTCPPPEGKVRCLTEGTGQSQKQFIQGWAVDPRKPEGPSHVHFYYDSSPGNTSDPDAIYNRNDVFGTIPLSPDEIIARKNEGYRGILDDGKYRFKVEIPDGLHDGENHTLNVYQITVSGTNPQLEYVLPPGPSITFGPNIPCGTDGTPVDKWYWPWLQTENGDVLASGTITGQHSDAGLPGARNPNQADKEAEYLIISAAGGNGPFCSTYDYILTNTAATTGNCGNGSGYNTLNLYNLAGGGDDKVYKAIEDAFNANGAGQTAGEANTKCSPYNTFTGLNFEPIRTGFTDPASPGQPTCLNGSIFRYSGGLGPINVISGRNTIFSDSDIFIQGDIKYDYTSGYDNPKKVPNLAIIVKGDIKISKDVTRIDATLYATGKIYSCNSNGNPGQTSPPQDCREQLVVNGMLVGKDGYLFGRSFHNDARSPAELIRLTGQSISFPPPGLDNLYFSDFNNDVRIDSGEYQPRF